MVSKLGFLLLLACVGCVLLFFILMEKNLRSQISKTHLQSQMTYERIGKSLGDTRIIIKPSCNATFLIWIITSYAGDPSARSALRRAYVDEELQTLGIERVFLLGKLNDNAEKRAHVSQEALLDESRRFNDILQGDFLDTYRNLTYKHLMGLRWATNNCKYVKYIMKMDDDIVVNIYDLLEKLHSDIMEKDSLAGYVMKNMVPVREPASKWKGLNIKIQDISKIYTTDHRYLECCIKGKTSLLKCEFLIGPNGSDTELQVRFKEFAKFCHINCFIRAENNFVGKTCVVAYKEPYLHKGAFQINPFKIL